MEKVKVEKDHSFILGVIKGALIALCVSLLGILIFAFITRFVSISDSAIAPVNQFIKGLSVFIGCFIGLRKTKEMGLISGLMVGIFYTAIAFVVFSILDGHFAFSKTILNDLLFGGIIGSICGTIAVNFLHRKNK